MGKIFAGTASLALAKKISQKSKISLGQIDIGRFSDGEIDVWIKEDVNNSNVFIIQSTPKPTSDNILELALIADALKRSGAHKITAVIPYLSYSRKEKQSRTGEPISAKVVADIITSSGINKIITIDLHADAIVGFFNAPVIHLSAQSILAERVRGEKLNSPIIVSPDVGGVRRARNFASLLKLPLVVIEKRRHPNMRDTIEILSMSGQIAKDSAVIIDDIISTGSTIIESALALKKEGVKKVIVCASHGVFASSALENLEKSLIDKIFVTDTISKNITSDKIEIVSTADLIANCLRKEV